MVHLRIIAMRPGERFSCLGVWCDNGDMKIITAAQDLWITCDIQNEYENHMKYRKLKVEKIKYNWNEEN